MKWLRPSFLLSQGRILVGHAIRNDLNALLIGHPRKLIRDTAKCPPLHPTHQKHSPTPLWCRPLRRLVPLLSQVSPADEGTASRAEAEAEGPQEACS